MKKINTILFILPLMIVLAACQPKAAPTVYLEGPDRDALVAQVDPFAQDILNGIATNDYALFSKDFDAAMLKGLPLEKFPVTIKSLAPFGTLKSSELVNVVDDGTYYGVNYKVTYEKQVVLMRVVVPKVEPRLVTGLWFK